MGSSKSTPKAPHQTQNTLPVSREATGSSKPVAEVRTNGWSQSAAKTEGWRNAARPKQPEVDPNRVEKSSAKGGQVCFACRSRKKECKHFHFTCPIWQRMNAGKWNPFAHPKALEPTVGGVRLDNFPKRTVDLGVKSSVRKVRKWVLKPQPTQVHQVQGAGEVSSK